MTLLLALFWIALFLVFYTYWKYDIVLKIPEAKLVASHRLLPITSARKRSSHASLK